MNLASTKTKAQYGFIRAGYGNLYKDYRCDTYRTDAIANDWPYGMYWYCYPGYSWQAHADHFAEVLSEFPYQLDVVLDAETTNLNPSATLSWLVNMRDRVADLTGKEPAIYTSPGFWNSKVAPSAAFANSRLWVAHWTLTDQQILPFGWDSYKKWQ